MDAGASISASEVVFVARDLPEGWEVDRVATALDGNLLALDCQGPDRDYVADESQTQFRRTDGLRALLRHGVSIFGSDAEAAEAVSALRDRASACEGFELLSEGVPLDLRVTELDLSSVDEALVVTATDAIAPGIAVDYRQSAVRDGRAVSTLLYVGPEASTITDGIDRRAAVLLASVN
jgi:hypothetical protein